MLLAPAVVCAVFAAVAVAVVRGAPKPFTPDALARAVREAIDARGRQALVAVVMPAEPPR